MKSSFVQPDVEQIKKLLGEMVGRRITVIGDAMLDAYIIGEVARISPEAPVPVMNVADEQCMLGGAANVARCLVALGAQVRLCCLIGDDEDGELFLREADNLGVDACGVIVDANRPTTRKTRIVARHQQVIRLDYETPDPATGALEKRLINRVQKAVRWAHGVVLSDYGKGVLTERLCRAAIKAAAGRPVLVDPKDLPWTRYRGATVIKPNRREATAFTGQSIDSNAAALKSARRIGSKLNVQHVLITRGAGGMTLAANAHSRTGRTIARRNVHLESQPRDLIDVTGAGDVVAATMMLALAGGAEVAESAHLANLAAGVKVGKFGAAAVTGQEILETLHDGQADYERKVLNAPQAAALAARLRKQKKKVVFTNGCFDLLHVGHVNYLERSRRQGDALLVGVNTDASVRRLKGEGRPVQNEHDRAHILASLSFVDAVVLFDQDTPLNLIRAVKPAVLTKGADYRRKRDVVGWDVVEKHGGRVALIPLVADRSTTKLIKRAKTK